MFAALDLSFIFARALRNAKDRSFGEVAQLVRAQDS